MIHAIFKFLIDHWYDACGVAFIGAVLCQELIAKIKDKNNSK